MSRRVGPIVQTIRYKFRLAKGISLVDTLEKSGVLVCWTISK